MKILMLLESSYPDLRVENEIGALLEAGHKIMLLCRGESNEINRGVEGLTIIRNRISRFRASKTSIAHPWLRYYERFWRARAFALATHQRFEVIHVHDLPLARVGYELAQATGAKFVLDLHENWPALLANATHTKKILGRMLHSPKAWARYEREYVMKADRVITVSEMSADRVSKMTDREWVFVVRNTVNLATMPAFGFTPPPDDGPLRLFYGGGINKHRGLQNVIEAIKMLESRTGIVSIVLMIVGSGSYKKTLQRQARGMTSIWFKNPKPFSEFMTLMAGSHVAIIPHLRNENNDTTCPHKLFQAMYAGVTVVSSDCPYLKSVIDDTGCGYVYNTKKVDYLAELLMCIHLHRILLHKDNRGILSVLDKYNFTTDEAVLKSMYKNLKP